ncbi:MAG TPA: hypothetical protein VFQ39_13630 [Longimicrobium sp.]|nr:hypothetical protein [Longimicrobium sp.]
MPVIVNEMEVVLAAEGGGGQPMESAPPPLPPPDPRATAELLERRARNELRLYAH